MKVRAWFDGLGRGQRVAVVALTLFVVVNLALSGVGSLLGQAPGGPVSSSFSTGSSGLEGFADLARAEGHQVTRLDGRVDQANLSTDATVVVADPQQAEPGEAQALIEFVQGGGRLVLVGENTAGLLAAATSTDVRWTGEGQGTGARVSGPGDAVGSARHITGLSGGRWNDVTSLDPLAGDDAGPVLVSAEVGAGEVIALSDSGPLTNEHLADADNAALALGLAGQGRPVVFAESFHQSPSAGLDALPSSWKWFIAGLLIALVMGMWSAGTRFGPAEASARSLRPPRLDHVEAVAADLDRVTHDPARAVAPLVDPARRELAEMLALPADASPQVLARVAIEAGWEPADVELLVSPADTPDAALAAGELAARRQRMARRLADTVPDSRTNRGAP